LATVALGYRQPSLTSLNHSERLGPAGAPTPANAGPPRLESVLGEADTR
jgi:hypothetical protein